MFSCNMCILELYLGDNISLGPESGSCVLETIAPSGNAFPTTHKHDIKNKNITHTQATLHARSHGAADLFLDELNSRVRFRTAAIRLIPSFLGCVEFDCLACTIVRRRGRNFERLLQGLGIRHCEHDRAFGVQLQINTSCTGRPALQNKRWMCKSLERYACESETLS